jgi:hypothetical protein
MRPWPKSTTLSLGSGFGDWFRSLENPAALSQRSGGSSSGLHYLIARSGGMIGSKVSMSHGGIGGGKC